METYRIHKKDWTNCRRYARLVSKLSGKSFFYHWIDCMYCVARYGCGASQYYAGLYKLRSFDRDKTYTKYRSYKAMRIFNNPQFQYIYDDKVEFNRHFSNYVKRNWIYCKEATYDEINAFLIANIRIIVKPLNQSKGRGIFVLDRNISNEEHIRSFIKKDILLEQFIVQHPQMSFDNMSVNTIRVNTILDSKGDVHVIKAALRCGVGNSVVDNYSAGGVVYPINIEYGRIEGAGVGKSNQFNRSIFVHPGTSMFMVGKEIPFWNETLEMVNNAAKELPQIRFVGWDVAITNDGPELVEGNTRPGASVIENMGIERGFWRKILSYK